MTEAPTRPPAAPAAPGLPRTGLLLFAGGSVGMGIWVTVPGLLLLYFLTDMLAVSPLLAGMALLVPKIADVALHPWVGHLSDTDLAARGHRRRLMTLGCALTLAFAALFLVPAGVRGAMAAGWVALAYVAGNLLFAAYQVPYLSTQADLAIGYHERTRLMGYRMVVLTLGILLSGVGAPLIAGREEPSRGGYALMGAILGVIMIVFMAVGIAGVRRLTATAGRADQAGGHAPVGRRALGEALRDRQFRWLVGAYLAMSSTTHLVLAAVPYYARYELGRPGLTTVLVAAFVAPALLATPVWAGVSRRVGKQRGLRAAQAGFVAGALVLAAGNRVETVVLVGAVAVLGVAFAAMQLLAFSMVPDVIRAANAGSRAGAYTGVWTATEAIGGALGPYLYAACLAAGGFVASAAGEQVAQSPAALTAVRYGFGLVPAVLMLVALLLQGRYTLDRAAAAAPAAPLLPGR